MGTTPRNVPGRMDALPKGTEVILHGTVVGSDRDGCPRVAIKGADGTTRNISFPASMSATEYVIPTGPTCICGCGTPASRGRFAIGHDAKLQSLLMRQLYSGDPQAVAAAALELHLHGWLGAGPSTWGVGRDLLEAHGSAADFLGERARQRTVGEDGYQLRLAV